MSMTASSLFGASIAHSKWYRVVAMGRGRTFRPSAQARDVGNRFASGGVVLASEADDHHRCALTSPCQRIFDGQVFGQEHAVGLPQLGLEPAGEPSTHAGNIELVQVRELARPAGQRSSALRARVAPPSLSKCAIVY